MKPVVKGLLLVSLVPIQTHVLSLLPVRIPLDLVLVTAYYHGYFHGKIQGMTVGASLGLLTDILSGELLGSQMFLKTLVGYVAAVFGFGIFSRDVPVHLLLLALFSLADGLLRIFLLHVFTAAPAWSEAFWRLTAPAVAANTLVGAVAIHLLRRRSEDLALEEAAE